MIPGTVYAAGLFLPEDVGRNHPGDDIQDDNVAPS